MIDTKENESSEIDFSEQEENKKSLKRSKSFIATGLNKLIGNQNTKKLDESNK